MRDWEAKRLLEWHRQKQGSIEAPRDVLKNELAAGVLPGGRFGANAAWRRLGALTHNLVTAMKRWVLPPERLRARPQRLRFLVFTQPGKFVVSCAAAQVAIDARLETFFNLFGGSISCRCRRRADGGRFPSFLFCCWRPGGAAPQNGPAGRGGSPPRARSPGRKTPSAPPASSRCLLRTG